VEKSRKDADRRANRFQSGDGMAAPSHSVT
jgi:hypothetical protein